MVCWNPMICQRLFETLAQEKINVILITQASSEHSICFGVNSADALRAKMLLIYRLKMK